MADEGKVPRLRDIPKDLDAVNNQLQDMATKLDNLASIPALRINAEPFNKVERNLEAISKFSKKWSDALIKQNKSTRDIKKELAEIVRSNERLLKREKEILDLQKKKGGKLGKKKTQELDSIQDRLRKQKIREDELLEGAKQIDSKWTTIAKLIGQDVVSAFDKLGRSILALGIDSLVGTVELLKKGFAAVYDLVDRSVHASGEFAMQLGAMSQNMASLQKEGEELEGTMRALTGEGLGVGKRELAEAARGFGFLDDKFKALRQQSVYLGRAFGVGSAAAGQLTRQFYLAGDSAEALEKDYGAVAKAANEAGVPVSDFTKDILSSSKFMASFGRQSRQVFLDSARYAMRYGLSLKSLESFVDMSDTFEGAATAAAKLNAVFGTSINGLELMMENDPSKRLEMVRKALLAQGKTWDNLSRQERKFLAQTMSVSEEELQGLLSSKKSFGEFQKQKAAAAKKEADEHAMIQAAIKRTAMTVLNWGQAFDQVTAAIKPIFDDLLGKDFFQKLPGRVQAVIRRFREFVDVFRKNKAVSEFVSKIRQDFGGLFDAFSTKGPMSAKTIETINDAITRGVKFVELFYDYGKKALAVAEQWGPPILKVFGFLVDNADTILKFWAGFKIGGALISGANAFLGILGTGTTIGGAVMNLGGMLWGGASSLAASANAAALALSGGGVGLAGLGLAAAAGLAAFALTKYALDNTELGKKINKNTVSFFEEQSATWDKLMSVFSEEARNKQIRQGEVELNNALARAGSQVRVGQAATVKPAQVHLQPPPGGLQPDTATKGGPGGKAKEEVIHVHVNVDSQEVGKALVKRQATQ